MSINGKVALVTGASRGIGRAIAIELAREGVLVAINYRTNEDEAKKTLEEIKALGGNGVLLQGDVSSYDECKSMIQDITNILGKIDILVNNAGVSKVGLFMDMDIKEIDSLMSTNLKGVINLTHAALPHMVGKKSGTIINISSIWGNVGASCEVIYSTSKGGINLFTKSLAKEMSLSGIRINAIAPGVIDTEMNNFLSNEEKECLKEEIPMGCFGEGKDIADAVLFLCSNKSKYITGQVLTIDGGFI